MQAIAIRQSLIEKLIELNKKNKSFLSVDANLVDLPKLKKDIQQNLFNLKWSTRIYEILGYVCFAIVGILLLIKIFNVNSGPDLNKGSVLIFLTIVNLFSAFRQKLGMERLEKQILLLDLLEKFDVEKPE